MTREELKEIKLEEEKGRGLVSKDLKVSKTIKFKGDKGFMLSTISRDSIEKHDIKRSTYKNNIVVYDKNKRYKCENVQISLNKTTDSVEIIYKKLDKLYNILSGS